MSSEENPIKDIDNTEKELPSQEDKNTPNDEVNEDEVTSQEKSEGETMEENQQQEDTAIPEVKSEPKIETEWYVLRVVSGKERKIKEQLDAEISRSEWGHVVVQVLVPTEKVYKIQKGKKVIRERNFYPGYMLIEAVRNQLNGDIIQTIRSTTNVINFLGKENPTPLRKAEVNRILGKVDEMQDVGESLNEPYLVGETVKIVDGPFNDFNGTIEEIYDEKKKLKVIVKIFGRRTPVELNFVQVEKQS